MGSNPARVACEGVFIDTQKALSIQCYTHVGVGQKLNQLFIQPISNHVIVN